MNLREGIAGPDGRAARLVPTGGSADVCESEAPLLPPVRQWGVARTKSRCEKALARYLKERGVAHFLPLVKRRNVWKRLARNFYHPLFPGYVFLDIGSIGRREVFASRKVADLLDVPDQELLERELRNLALALRNDDSLRETMFGKAGKPVRVARGNMKGLCGEIVRIGSRTTLILRVSFLSKAAELEIDEGLIEPLL